MPLSFSTTGPRSYNSVSAALFALAVATSAFALGALHTPVLCVVAVLLAISAFVGWFPASPIRSRLPATILLATGVFLTLFTAVQALSLPASVVRALSPAAAEVWAGALAPFREPGPRWTSLSLDPTATRLQVLRGVVYVTAFLVALRIADRRRGTRFLSVVIVGTALVLAMASLLHPMFGAQRVFGIYKPEENFPERHVAPLLNANHLAAYINIGFCLTLGLAVDRRAHRHRPIAIAVALLLAATQVWVASRGGALAMVFGGMCVLLMARVSRRSQAHATRAGWNLILPGLVVAAGLAMIVIGSTPEAVSELNSTDVSKIRIALSALPLALRYPLFGVGRGAFEVAFPSTRHDGTGYVNFTHPENILVQWFTEWGIPVAILALIALGTALRPKVLLVSSSPAIGAWAAIATTAVHNLVDFNSEVPAIGIAVAACGAMLVSGRGSPRAGAIHAWGSHPRVLAVALGVAAMLSIAVALVGWPHELDKDRADLYAVVREPVLRHDAPEVIREALRRHPSEAYLPFIASVDASRRAHSVIPWVARALELAPIYGPAHFVLAEQLERESPSQARLEYRLAITQDRQMLPQALLRGAPLVADYDEALELVPEPKALRLAVLDVLADMIGARLPATRMRLDDLIRKLDANAQGPLDRTVSDAIADLGASEAAPWCEAKAACVKPALAAVKRLAGLQPGRCGPAIARAQLELAADNGSNALHDLQIAAQTSTDPTECWRSLGELAFTAKNDVYITVAEEAMARSGCATDAECADNLMWVASVEEHRGNLRRAIGYYERAQEKAPERRDIVERIAQLASGLGMHAQALDAYRKLQRTSPDAEKWRQLADREKTQLFHEAVP